jgi:ATP sulfurylase
MVPRKEVMRLYKTSTLCPKQIARRVNLSPENVRAIIHRDNRGIENPISMLPPKVKRRLAKAAEREKTTVHGLAAAILEIVTEDYRLLLQVKASARLATLTAQRSAASKQRS